MPPERPIHFSILSLVATASFLAVVARSSDHDGEHSPSRRFLNVFHPAVKLPTHSGGAGRGRLACLLRSGADQVRRLVGPFCLLVAGLVLRTFLFWLTVRTTQCAYPGLEVRCLPGLDPCQLLTRPP